jgi:hypothetical protein
MYVADYRDFCRNARISKRCSMSPTPTSTPLFRIGNYLVPSGKLKSPAAPCNATSPVTVQVHIRAPHQEDMWGEEAGSNKLTSTLRGSEWSTSHPAQVASVERTPVRNPF